MEVLRQFDFATVICDGCARRVDSHVDDEWMRDYDELIECYLPDNGWEPQDKDEEKWLCPECIKDKSHRKHPGEGRVIIEPTTLSGMHCDLCGKHFENYDGYSFWEEYWSTKEFAREEDWVEIGGKFYCPDCYKHCPAIEDEEEENYEEVYCKKCPYEDDCSEYWPREKPEPSEECTYAQKNEKGNWHKCKHYVQEGCKSICNIPDGEKCPRVAQCEKDRPEIEKKNKELLEKILRKGKGKKQ